MSENMISAIVLEQLKEALCSIYWYKNQLKGFLLNCISNKNIVNNADWSKYKVQIVSDIIDELSYNQEKYLGDLRRLIHEVTKINDFRHLLELEDGKKKADRAKKSVTVLKNSVEDNDSKIKEEEKIARLRKENREKINSSKAVLKKLDEIKERYFSLFAGSKPQERGYELEKIMYDIFSLFDLDPKASFKKQGEQIDGAFSLDGTDYLFEAKWQQYACNASDLDSFTGKISRKLDNTLGLFLSINGFSPDAVTIHSAGKSVMILMDGEDLMAVLENQIDITTLIVRKRRHASQTGNIYLKVREFLYE